MAQGTNGALLALGVVGAVTAAGAVMGGRGSRAHQHKKLNRFGYLYDAATKERIGPATEKHYLLASDASRRWYYPGSDGTFIDPETGRRVYVEFPD